MSLYDYEASKRITAEGWSFYAIIMAAMRHADSTNTELLKFAWPHVYAELRERYNAPGGLLETDQGYGEDKT